MECEATGLKAIPEILKLLTTNENHYICSPDYKLTRINIKPMKRYFFVIAVFTIIFAGCSGSGQKQKTSEKSKGVPAAEKQLWAQAQTFFKVLPKVADNPENPVTDAKVKLGKMLYFDNRLSLHETQSCNTCHNLSTYGVDHLPTSPGDNGEPGDRNSPTVLNAALKTAQFWDGRNKDVEEQAGGPVLNPDEMGMPSEQAVVDRLKKDKTYRELFKAAYPDEKDPITFTNMRNAIGAFERTLMTPSRFDQYLSGNFNALDEQEKKGLKDFINAGCIACHRGSVVGGNMLDKFPQFGEYTDYIQGETIDYGKYEETKKESDKFMFFVPQLRNVAKTEPYMHNGSVKELDDAVKIMGKAQLNKELTDEQVKDIVAFLNTLTGEVPAEWMQPPAGLKQ